MRINSWNYLLANEILADLVNGIVYHLLRKGRIDTSVINRKIKRY